MMRARSVAFALLAAVTVAGCGGGGGTSSTTAALPAALAPSPSGSVTMTLAIPRRHGASAHRAPRYISPGMFSAGIYDGATLVWAGNFNPDGSPSWTAVYARSGFTTVTPSNCTNNAIIVCTFTITTPVGAHTFGIVAYSSAQTASGGNPPAFTGNILSEGQLPVTIAVGTNPGASMVLLGVANHMNWGGATSATVGQTVTVTYQVLDGADLQIIQPGNYDNGPVTITASGTASVTTTPSSISNTTPPSTNGDQSFDVHCNTTGSITFTASAKAAPNTAYQFGLTYTSANYASTTLGTTSFTCNADSATVPITIQ